jgi:hypothetical protein
VSAYYENKDYSNSLQKEDGRVYGIGADIHYNNSEYKITYEDGKANTKQPPLSKDLENKKLFLRYAHNFVNKISFNINYINILNDNIAITDNGKTYGLGIGYKLSKQFDLNFTQFYTKYDDFKTHQSDFRVDYKFKISKLNIKLSSISKYISLDTQNKNSFTKNAKKDYFTNGLKLHLHYKSYHLGSGVYLGKRAFAIMSDGFKIQHHAMEFDRTYAVGVGKTINSFVFRFQYIYQRATELPMLNEDVKIKTFRVITNYKF